MMNFNLREPNPGDKISANMVREIIRAIRSLTPISGHRMKTSTGPNGTVYDVKDEDRNKSQKEPDKGRYAISSIEVDDQGQDQDSSTASITFANPYYRIGGKTYTGSNETGDFDIPSIVALKVNITGSTPYAQLVSYASLAELQAAEANEDYYIHPLYKLSSTGAVECDFRIGPTSDMGEFNGVPT